MELQRTRIFLLVSLLVVGLALYSAWQREYGPVVTQPQEQTAVENNAEKDAIPTLTTVPVTTVAPVNTASLPLIDVQTDVLKVKIDPNGGDLVQAELLKYPQDLHDSQGVLLLDKSNKRHYVAQSGLIGKDELGPDSHQFGRAQFTAQQSQYQLSPDQQQLQVQMFWENSAGLKVTKIYTFQRGSYLIDVAYRIANASAAPWQGSFYGQIRREYVKEKSGNGMMIGAQMYQGGAYHTPDKPYKKISYPDMKKAPLREQIKGGWAAMVERYFLSAWLGPDNATNQYYTRVDNENIYNIGSVTPLEVLPGQEQEVKGRLYVGPEDGQTLKEIAPGLNLTIDYGILWPISQLLFWLLKTIHSFIGNWGWSIILVTLIIKIAFYQLSASSYRSMGKMRRLQPRIELLKERHKEDKQQFSASLLELYRKEKVNPLGGCLPILIQIPVFIALYYVLLESVELRQAPFILWIQDLSVRDPFYILPLIMGATMFLQQRMNPAPPDPMQAKVMMFMPIIFTALFLAFPAGLVLYWTVNNILSITQQWYITRNLEKETLPVKKGK